MKRIKNNTTWTGYKSPISIAFKETTTKLEQDIINNVYTAVMEYGIDVDKEELLKALKYDRGQYEEGYSKGYCTAKSEVVRCKDCAVPHNKWTGCPHLNGLIPPPDHYCAKGERKEQE
jgi:hypothetical protein